MNGNIPGTKTGNHQFIKPITECKVINQMIVCVPKTNPALPDCFSVTILSCKKVASAPDPEPPVQESMYFPPIGSGAWSTTAPASLDWNEASILRC